MYLEESGRQSGLSRMLVWILASSAVSVAAMKHKTMAMEEYVDVPGNYCTKDVFNASCRPDEVILMRSAFFGRMKIGKCVFGNYGILGCSVNILRHMDSLCSGRKTCKLEIPDNEMYRLNQCSEEFSSYMEASYRCVRVAVDEGRRCHQHKPLRLRETSGYIASEITQKDGAGSLLCPWLIEVNPGQRINVTLFNFATNYRHPSASYTSGDTRHGTDVCFDLMQITEGTSDSTVIKLCGSDARQSQTYLSKTNQIRVAFLDRNLLKVVGSFVLNYQAVSCPDVRPPPAAWVQRDGNTLTIRCNFTQETWYLTCNHDNWVGELGNCSTSKGHEEKWSLGHVFSEDEIFPYGILVVVAIGVVLGVLIGGILLAVIFLLSKRAKRRRPSSKAYHECNKEHLRILDTANSNNGALGVTAVPEWSRDGGQYTDEGIVRDIRSPLPARDRPVADEHDHVMAHADHHVFHPAGPHICDVIPQSEPFTTFRPRTHMYESPHFT